MRMNDSEGNLCKYLEGEKNQDIVFSYSNSVTYDGKASVFLSCVDAIQLTLCVRVQKNLLYRDFRKEGR